MNAARNSAYEYQMDRALDQAIEFLTISSGTPPASEDVVKALLMAEKTTKRTKH